MSNKLKPLIEQLKAPHFLVREKAVKALMELRAEAQDAIPMLIEALSDRSWRVREVSAGALGVIGSCFSDDELKGSKKKDYVATSNACRFLRRLYDSCAKVADKVGVSNEIIREFDSLEDLPNEFKEMVAAGTIRLDTGHRISTQKSVWN